MPKLFIVTLVLITVIRLTYEHGVIAFRIWDDFQTFQSQFNGHEYSEPTQQLIDETLYLAAWRKLGNLSIAFRWAETDTNAKLDKLYTQLSAVPDIPNDTKLLLGAIALGYGRCCQKNPYGAIRLDAYFSALQAYTRNQVSRPLSDDESLNTFRIGSIFVLDMIHGTFARQEVSMIGWFNSYIMYPIIGKYAFEWHMPYRLSYETALGLSSAVRPLYSVDHSHIGLKATVALSDLSLNLYNLYNFTHGINDWYDYNPKCNDPVFQNVYPAALTLKRVLTTSSIPITDLDRVSKLFNDGGLLFYRALQCKMKVD